MSASQDARVQRLVRTWLPADVRRLATAGSFYFCVAVPKPGHVFAIAFHVPIPNVGSRADVRWVIQVASPSVAAASVNAIRNDPARFLATFGIDKRTHVKSARSLHAFVIVTMSQIRTG